MKKRCKDNTLKWLYLLGLLNVIVIILVLLLFSGKLWATSYEALISYSDTTADSVRWYLIVDGAKVDSGLASKWGGNTGLWIDTVTIGAQRSVWLDYKIWTGTAYDRGGYYLNQRANVIALADDSTAAQDLDARIDSILDTAVAILDTLQAGFGSRSTIGDTIQREAALQTEVANLNGWNPTTDSVLTKNPDAYKADLTGLSTFDPTTDSVLPDMSVLNAGLDKTGYRLSALGIDSIWEYDTANVSAGMGAMLKDTSAYQGSGSSLTAAQIADAVWDEDTSSHNTAGSYGVLIKDTSAYQGSASGLTSAQIADAVWDESRSGHTTSGTFGYYLDATVSSASGGSGANLVRIYAIDTSGTDDTLSSIAVTVQNATGSKLAILTTNDSGFAEFNLPSGTMKVLATLGASYVFPDTEYSVSGNDTFAILGYNTTVSSPSNPAKALVYGTVYDRTGGYASNVIVEVKAASRNLADTVSGVIISPLALYDTTDASGYFSFELIRTNQYADTTKGFYKIQGIYNRFKIFDIDSLYVPATGNVDLTNTIATQTQ
jgi:hypothetical protein